MLTYGVNIDVEFLSARRNDGKFRHFRFHRIYHFLDAGTRSAVTQYRARSRRGRFHAIFVSRSAQLPHLSCYCYR